jgi:RNA 3'-terminal phosphate cyclase (ATP)
LVEVESEELVAIFTSFGRVGVSAEKVAADVAEQVRVYLASEAAVCEHLADQLLLPMALAGGGSFRTGKISSHARTNMEVIRRFLPVIFSLVEERGQVKVAVERS